MAIIQVTVSVRTSWHILSQGPEESLVSRAELMIMYEVEGENENGGRGEDEFITY